MKKEQTILKVDSKNRITLPKKISESVGKLVQISMQNGKIILEPLHIIPQEEAWLFEPQNKTILTELKKSLKQKATINLGSFAQYAPKEKKKK
ncbi:MAG: hypothetical protein WC747_04505 [Candidatus Babeliales bacterium]|jgi:DNA-binding transcriptional regulator/RsmH inhibitor MraZ